MTSETRFVGSIPALYDRHLGPCLFEPYAVDLALRLPPSALRVVEVAAGTGRVTRRLLDVLPVEGRLTATDLNAPMLEVARSLIADDPRLTWQQADAQALPFPDGSAEAVVCQFGLMFVPDKVAALREMKRILAPGGIVLVATWDDLARNPASQLLHARAQELVPGGGLDFMRVPFSMPDPRELERLATEAGLRGVRVETVTKTGESESAAHLAHGFVRGNPLFLQLTERGADPAALEADVAARLASAFGDRPCRTPLSAHVLTAFAWV